MLIDTHFHLDLMENMHSMIRDIRNAEIGIIAVGTTPKAYEKEKQFCRGVDHIKVALGFHPQLVKDRVEEIELFLRLLKDAKYIGEIGLDFNKDYIVSKDQQLSCFRRIARACADEGGKVLSIHSVKAAGVIIDEMERAETFHNNICILHWFTGTASERRRAIDNGAYFSINPRMLNTKSGQETIRGIPEDRILLETDAPFVQGYSDVSDLKDGLSRIIRTISEFRGNDCFGQIVENNQIIWNGKMTMDSVLFNSFAETLKKIMSGIRIDGPKIYDGMIQMASVFGKQIEDLRPKMLETFKALIPYLEILPKVVDWAICSEMSFVCFVMPEKPDQLFLDLLCEASKQSKTVFVSEEQVEEIYSAEAIDRAITSYLDMTNYQMTERAIAIIDDELQNDKLWIQSVESYRQSGYAVAILGFAALVDRMLSKYSGISDTGIKSRVNEIIQREKEGQVREQDEAEAFLINTYEHCASVYGLYRDFSEEEPPMLNRHWLMHGRRNTAVTQLDCVKVLHILYATISIGRSAGTPREEECESSNPNAIKRLNQLMKQAIKAFNRYERHLIENNASERCMCGRLAYQLQRAVLRSKLYKEYVVDIEYNIGMDGTPDGRKKVFGHNAFLDIVVHKREYDDEVGFDNLIVIEMKKTKLDFEEDKERLRCLTNSKDGFGYKAGFAIKVDRENNRLIIDEDFYYPSNEVGN